MCGRVAQFSDPDTLADRFGLETPAVAVQARYNFGGQPDGQTLTLLEPAGSSG